MGQIDFFKLSPPRAKVFHAPAVSLMTLVTPIFLGNDVRNDVDCRLEAGAVRRRAARLRVGRVAAVAHHGWAAIPPRRSLIRPVIRRHLLITNQFGRRARAAIAIRRRARLGT